MENQHFPQQNEANRTNDWSAYVNQSVKVSALDGKHFEGIMEHVDGEHLHLLIPINIPEGMGTGDGRAFGYPGVGGWHGRPGYWGGYPAGFGYPGGYASPYGPYGFGHFGRPFGRLTLPLAALTALTVI